MVKIYMQRVRKIIKRRRWNILLFFMIFIIMAGIIAKDKIENLHILQNSEEMTEYRKGLEIYDEEIEALELAGENTKKTVDQLQEYIDNSIYMQLDSQHIYVSETRYMVQANDYEKIEDLLTMYVEDGRLYDEILLNYPDMKMQYLKEIISYKIDKEFLEITVFYADEYNSNKLMDIIEQFIERIIEDIYQRYNEIEIQKLDNVSYVQAVQSVLDAQNTKITELRGYQNALADLKQKLLYARESKKNYIDGCMPYYVNLSEKRIVFNHLVVGIIASFIVAICLVVLEVVIDERIYNLNDLKALKLNIITDLKHKDKEERRKNVSFFNRILENNIHKNLFFYITGESSFSGEASRLYLEELKQNDINIYVSNSVNEDVIDLKEMLCAGNCIFVIEYGKTTYSQIIDHIHLCKKFDILILGAIIV